MRKLLILPLLLLVGCIFCIRPVLEPEPLVHEFEAEMVVDISGEQTGYVNAIDSSLLMGMARGLAGGTPWSGGSVARTRRWISEWLGGFSQQITYQEPGTLTRVGGTGAEDSCIYDGTAQLWSTASTDSASTDSAYCERVDAWPLPLATYRLASYYPLTPKLDTILSGDMIDQDWEFSFDTTAPNTPYGTDTLLYNMAEGTSDDEMNYYYQGWLIYNNSDTSKRTCINDSEFIRVGHARTYVEISDTTRDVANDTLLKILWMDNELQIITIDTVKRKINQGYRVSFSLEVNIIGG